MVPSVLYALFAGGYSEWNPHRAGLDVAASSCGEYLMFGIDPLVLLKPYLGSIPAEPNWVVVTLIGALVGALVIPTAKFSWNIVQWMNPHPMCTTWFSYHMTFRDDEPVMLSGIYRISRGLRSGLMIRAENLAAGDDGQPRKTLFYRGTMEREGGQYIMNLSGQRHKERLVIRFIQRIPPSDSILAGIWLAYDHDNHVAAGVQIFSRKPLSPAVARRALLSWIAVHPGAMRLRDTRQREAENPAVDGDTASVFDA